MMICLRTPATLVTVLCFCLASCSPEKEAGAGAEVQALKAEYETLSARLADLSAEKDQLEAAIKADAALLKSLDQDVAREAALKEAVLPVSNYLASLEKASGTVKADIEIWRQATRDSYVGMHIPQLQTNSGALHADVTITEIHDDRFVVEDKDGNRIEVPFDDVNEAIRKALVHEPTVLSN